LGHHETEYPKPKPFSDLQPYPFCPQISAEAAYLYDAVHLYAKAVMEVLDSGGRPRNGSAIVAAIKGSRYRSAMGWVLSHLTANPQLMVFLFSSYHVYIDENGDAAGNYTVLARGTVRNGRNQTVLGLRPVGTFIHRNSSFSSISKALPVSKALSFTYSSCNSLSANPIKIAWPIQHQVSAFAPVQIITHPSQIFTWYFNLILIYFFRFPTGSQTV